MFGVLGGSRERSYLQGDGSGILGGRRLAGLGYKDIWLG